RQYLARTAAAGAPDVRAGAGPAWRLPGAARRAVAMGGLAAVFLGTWLVVRGPAGAPPAMQTAAAGAARSAGRASGSEGTPGLAGKRPWAWQDVRGRLAVVTDGEVAPEGSLWSSAPALVLTTAAATLTWDLGAVYPLQAIYVQADANDTYQLWGSADGRAFRPI